MLRLKPSKLAKINVTHSTPLTASSRAPRSNSSAKLNTSTLSSEKQRHHADQFARPNLRAQVLAEDGDYRFDKGRFHALAER